VIVADTQGLTYVNVPVVGADHVLEPVNYALTEIVYVAALAKILVAANDIVFPDKVIRELPLPPVTVMAYIIVCVSPELVVALIE
jgi:hypothetical protein